MSITVLVRDTVVGFGWFWCGHDAPKDQNDSVIRAKMKKEEEEEKAKAKRKKEEEEDPKGRRIHVDGLKHTWRAVVNGAFFCLPSPVLEGQEPNLLNKGKKN